MIGAQFIFEDTATPALVRLRSAVHGTSLATFMSTKANSILQERAKKRFDVEGDDASGSWAPLSFVTNFQRELEGYPPVSPINVRSGDLKSWLTSSRGTVGSTSTSAVNKWPGPTPAKDELAAKLRTAQFGRKSPNTPPRPVVGLGPTDLVLVMSGIQDWIETFSGVGSP